MKRTAAILLALSLPLAAAAQETSGEGMAEPRRYAVEVIVFAYAEDVFAGTEIFPPEAPGDAAKTENPAAGFPGAETAPGSGQQPAPVFGDLETGPGNRDAVAGGPGTEPDNVEAATGVPASKIDALLLPADALSMGRTYAQIERLDVYRPLLYTGWEQDAQPKEDAEPVPLSFFGPPPEGLEGSLTLYVGRYLHLVVDLALEGDSPPALPDDPWSTGTTGAPEPAPSYGDERLGWYGEAEPGSAYGPPRVVYRISEDRILRNGETRYFDHPKFGVIARITRIEEPEEEPAPGDPLPLISGPGE